MLFPIRWAMAALGSSVGLHSDKLNGDKLFGDSYTYHGTLYSLYSQADAMQYLWLAVGIMIVVFGVAIGFFLKRKDAYRKPPEQTYHIAMVGVQGTPTVDATMTALEKEKLTQEVDKLKNDNFWAWATSFGPILGYLGTIGTIVIGMLVVRNNFIQWSKNRQDEWKKRVEDQRIEREKRAEDQHVTQERRDEERFQSVVEGLGSERIETRVGAAIMLRTFLRPGYEQFYRQAFDLAIAHLRLRNADPNTCEPLDSLSQALIVAFQESFPLTRDELQTQSTEFMPQLLDASRIQLDSAYLDDTSLREAWMPKASLREAILTRANLSEANLQGANLAGADR